MCSADSDNDLEKDSPEHGIEARGYPGAKINKRASIYTSILHKSHLRMDHRN